jgi:hypothetical protein
MRIVNRALLLSVATALSACATPREQLTGDRPSLAEMFEGSLATRAETVMRHLIAGRTYYYAVSGCCDQLNPVYDAEGRYVCAPDGGFSGRGDGRCPADLLRTEWGRGSSVPNPFYRR